ncbi:TPA: hypothetical protein JG919_003841 [Enterobacter hormaechei subsp. steigerwaltii]|nr:hypothetical protein [Enterobacter hormaechei subsp. steigerwaltii]
MKSHIYHECQAVGERAQAMIPDGWPGIPMTGTPMRAISAGEEEYFVISGRQLIQSHWRNVVIVSTNPLAVTGIRWMLAPLCPVRLKTFNDPSVLTSIPSYKLADRPDIVVWLQLRDGGMTDIAEHVLVMRRRLPGLRQIIISDSIPADLYGRNLIDRVNILSPKATPLDITQALQSCLLEETGHPCRLFPERLLTHAQWRVLVLLSTGKTPASVASLLHLSAKTILLHRASAMRRLRLKGKPAEAWVIKNMRAVLSILPYREEKAHEN